MERINNKLSVQVSQLTRRQSPQSPYVGLAATTRVCHKRRKPLFVIGTRTRWPILATSPSVRSCALCQPGRDSATNVQASGAVSLTNVCQVAGLGYGRDGSYRYYMSEPVVSNDPKGIGPFIMAGIEISEMLGS